MIIAFKKKIFQTKCQFLRNTFQRKRRNLDHERSRRCLKQKCREQARHDQLNAPFVQLKEFLVNSKQRECLLVTPLNDIFYLLTNIHGTACDNVYHIRRNATKRIISIWLLFGLLGLQKLDILNIKVRFDVGDINFGFDIWMNYCGIKEEMLTFICVCSKRI